MQLRSLLVAPAAGVATALLVGAAVTEALLDAIAFSAIVGLPVGIAAGLLVGGVVLLALADADAPADQRNAATAVGAFGAGMLLTFAVGVALAGVTASAGLLVSMVAGLAIAVGTFVWLERNAASNVHAVTAR